MEQTRHVYAYIMFMAEWPQEICERWQYVCVCVWEAIRRDRKEKKSVNACNFWEFQHLNNSNSNKCKWFAISHHLWMILHSFHYQYVMDQRILPCLYCLFFKSMRAILDINIFLRVFELIFVLLLCLYILHASCDRLYIAFCSIYLW